MAAAWLSGNSAACSVHKALLGLYENSRKCSEDREHCSAITPTADSRGLYPKSTCRSEWKSRTVEPLPHFIPLLRGRVQDVYLHFKHTMRDLCILLTVLCLTSLVLSEFVSLIIKCNTESDEHLENCSATDQCMWKTRLEKCNSLELECTDSKNTICTSFEECGVANETEFVKYLDGSIDCEFYKKSIKCTSKLSHEHTNYVCNEPCKLKHIIPDPKYCLFSHSFKKCIKENEQFPVKGDLNCTVTYEKEGNNQEEGEKRLLLPTPECPLKPVCTETGYFYATLVLGIILSLVVLGLLFALFKPWKRRMNGGGITRDIQLSTINSPQVPLLEVTAAVPDPQHQDAAVPDPQSQDAAADSSLDDPQANVEVSIPQSQDGTLQESSQVKVVQEDEKGC